jgi:hypothetical protein
MFARAPAIRRDPSLAIPRACQAACSSTTRRSSPPVLLEPALALGQPLRAAPRNGLGLGCALGLEGLPGLAQPLAPIAAGAQPLGQLVTAGLAVELILRSIDPGRLREDLLRDLLIAARRVMRRRRRDLGAIDGDDPDLHKPRPGAQSEHASEQLGDRLLVAGPEASNRRVVGNLVGRDHPEGDIVATAPLDPTRRTHPDRIRVDEQRDHHLRIVGSGTPAVTAIGRIERPEIQLRNALKHEPGQVVLRQPLAQRRRQQQLLITIARQEVLGHRTPHRSGTTQSSPSTKTEQRPEQGFMRHPPRQAAPAVASFPRGTGLAPPRMCGAAAGRVI